jgi:hypothetical protein
LAFVRRRGNSHQLIGAYRTGGKVRQRILANLGPRVQQRSRPTERWLPASLKPSSPRFTHSSRRERAAYTATFARLGDPTRPKLPVKGGPFKTFAEAEAACKATWRSIQAAQ